MRSDGALKAALSIASQIRYYSLEGKVSISITDDASPNFLRNQNSTTLYLRIRMSYPFLAILLIKE